MAKLPVVVSTPEAPWALTKPRELLSSLGKSWLDVLRAKSLPQEVIAGLTVAAVALPLNIALAVACDLPPSAGLIAGAVGGAVAAIMGGSALQVTGPAAALNVMVLSLNHNFGSAGVAASCIFIGLIQIALCALAGGRLIRYVPESVLAGFTTGVGLKLLDSQIPELLGFNYTTTETRSNDAQASVAPRSLLAGCCVWSLCRLLSKCQPTHEALSSCASSNRTNHCSFEPPRMEHRARGTDTFDIALAVLSHRRRFPVAWTYNRYDSSGPACSY